MADANITSTIQLDAARHRIALEASWEVEKLSEIIRKEAKEAGDGCDITIRGLAVRLGDLSGILMSALDTSDALMPIDELSYKLRGEHAKQESIHV